jgi:hypothetical protein
MRAKRSTAGYPSNSSDFSAVPALQMLAALATLLVAGLVSAQAQAQGLAQAQVNCQCTAPPLAV